MGRLQAAALVARVAQLDEIRLVKLACEMDVSVQEVVDRECALVTHADPSHVVYDEETAKLSVDVSVQVSLHESMRSEPSVESPQVGRQLLQVSATYALVYQLPKSAPPVELQERLFESFASLNAVYNAWPYLRELVQSVTTRMGLPGVLMPLYRLPRSEEELGEARPTPKLKLVAGGE